MEAHSFILCMNLEENNNLYDATGIGFDVATLNSLKEPATFHAISVWRRTKEETLNRFSVSIVENGTNRPLHESHGNAVFVGESGLAKTKFNFTVKFPRAGIYRFFLSFDSLRREVWRLEVLEKET